MIMRIKIEQTNYQNITQIRQLFLQQNNFQIRYDACHHRNWADEYLIFGNDSTIGYVSIKGKEDYLKDRDALFEFFLLPEARRHTNLIFNHLVQEINFKFIECQSNDAHLAHLLFEFTKGIRTDTILFSDYLVTNYTLDNVLFRLRKELDPAIDKKKDNGQYILEKAGKVVADGGFLTHYNPPFADLFMKVRSEERNNGFGTIIVQEIKRVCYQQGKVPGARCHIDNKASKATLLKAGFQVAGFMLIGEVK